MTSGTRETRGLIPSLVVIVVFILTIHTVDSDCVIGNIETSYTLMEDTMASLHCAVQGGEVTYWTYQQTQLANDCTSQQTPYTVSCDVPLQTYNLTFNATWGNRGIYTCSCYTSSQAIIVEVEVPINSVSATCVLANVSPMTLCSETTIADDDIISITATTSCTYPNPTFQWFKNQTELNFTKLSISTKTEEIDCSEEQTGQKVHKQSFTAKYSTLGSPSKLEVLVQRDRAVSRVEVINFREDLIYGFAAAKIVGLILGVACAVGGITAGAIGLKKTLGKNAIKPKPLNDGGEANGNDVSDKAELTSVDT